MKSGVDIIVVNWNAGAHLLRCLSSIQSARRDHLGRVIVVDNASSDRSADHLDHIDLPMTVIRNSLNRGFSAACNQGAVESTAEYLLFLNPDARLNVDSIQTPLEFMEREANARVGICGIRLFDDSGHLTRSCARFPTPGLVLSWMIGLDRIFPSRFPSALLRERELQESRPVDQVMGAFFWVRRPTFEALGGFDERFFIYFEELDFSYRALREGWTSFYLTSTSAQHVGCGSSDQVKALRLCHWLTSRTQYCYKHFGRVIGTALFVGSISIEPVSRLALAFWRRSFQQVTDTVRGYLMFLGKMA